MNSIHDDFPFSNEELRLLILLSNEDSVKTAAQQLQRDQTTVTRQLRELSLKHPVLQKNNGAWGLTPLGREVANFARKMMNEQRSLVDLPKVIRIGTTKDFSEWVLTPKLASMMKSSGLQISVFSEFASFEQALLDGKIDFVISCGKPVDPIIKHKRLVSFPLTCVSPFKIPAKNSLEELSKLPAVEHINLNIKNVVPSNAINIQIVSQFDHVSGVRGAARSKLGWTILPHYTVMNDIKEKKLYEVELSEIGHIKEEFSVWYMREFSHLEKIVKHIVQSFN